VTRTWNAVLARLGVPTGDGRIIAPGGGSSRDLPLPISWQRVTDDGHKGSVAVARMESLRIADGMVTATGTMLASAPWEVYEELDAGIIGPSVDLDDIEYTVDDQDRIVITKWRIAGATLVQIPAFSDVSFTLDPVPVEPAEIAPPDDRADMPWGDLDAVLSSAAPALPPTDWFQRPDLDRLTPITVSDTGRVFGHIAGWETCHVGLPGCVTAPFSASGYAYFHVAEQPTAEGTVLPVGTLVAGPRHADPQLAFQAATQHYDDPAAAVARVVAGEDEHGIWVAGWMLPGATAEARQTFMSSPVSGDWRRIGGSLELIAVCSVNAPGFPVPRARVAFGANAFALGSHSEGVQRTLIASSGITPVEGEFPAPGKRDEANVARARWAWAQTGMEN
jgi:hypothetical protein